jgi:MFS superfamily sulfate permease-like transporter
MAAVGVLAFGPLYGLLLAVAGSLLGLVYRSSRVDVEVMGKVPHEKAGWGSIREPEERATFPGVMVLRVDPPIFWVTAAPIHDAILAKVDSAPGTKVLVLDMEETSQMDTTSADALADLLGSLRQRDIDLYHTRDIPRSRRRGTPGNTGGQLQFRRRARWCPAHSLYQPAPTVPSAVPFPAHGVIPRHGVGKSRHPHFGSIHWRPAG